MRKIIILVVVLTAMHNRITAQIYFTKNGSISFFSKTSFQDIEANNNQVISVLNIQTGVIQFSLLNNAFHFPKAKMEEDFNENYMENDKYPKSTFKGNIFDINKVNFGKDGTYPVNVKGDLMIHGVTKNITTPGTITIKNGNISANASFNILLKDYKISIPTIVINKIAENIRTTVNCSYEKK